MGKMKMSFRDFLIVMILPLCLVTMAVFSTFVDYLVTVNRFFIFLQLGNFLIIFLMISTMWKLQGRTVWDFWRSLFS